VRGALDRRAFLVVLGSGVLAAPLAARAQQSARVTRIGWLSAGSATTFASRLAAFRRGLRDLGHADDSILIDERWADGREERLPALAAELVRLRPAVIVSVGTPATLAAKQATDAIPIVMIAVGDPVGSGLVASLARPGGNITGVSNLAAELSGKLLDLLRDAVPGLTRVGILQIPANPVHAVYWAEIQVAAERLGIRVVAFDVRRPEDFETAFAAMVRQQLAAALVLPDPLNLIHRVRIAELALGHRLPTMFAIRDYAEAGGLMSYGPSSADLYRRAPTYVDKILRGARPADLPVEQPTKFDLVVNLKTARTLGLTIPPLLLARANEVIE